MIKIWLLFFGIVIAFFVYSNTANYDHFIGLPVNMFYAKISSIVLNIFGYQTQVKQYGLTGSGFSMSVAKGCDAVAATVMLITAISLYPYATIQNKFRGLGTGIALLFGVNLIRLISLFLLGIYAPSWFEFFHIQFWQAFFILLSMAYLIFWLKKYSN